MIVENAAANIAALLLTTTTATTTIPTNKDIKSLIISCAEKVSSREKLFEKYTSSIK
jgi:formylmethanofuran dehydrogenase subunit D